MFEITDRGRADAQELLLNLLHCVENWRNRMMIAQSLNDTQYLQSATEAWDEMDRVLCLWDRAGYISLGSEVIS